MRKAAIVVSIVLAIVLLTVGVSSGLFTWAESYWMKGGTVNYIGDDTSVTAPVPFPRVRAALREYGAGVDATVVGNGFVVIQATKGDGTRIRLSVRLDKVASVIEHSETRTYADYSGSIIYWEQGTVPVILPTTSIRVDVNKATLTANIAGGEDTPYKFRITDATISNWI
ncbi:MAG: hypothetical protein ABIC95_03205 [archaeon]